jgi:hypothetical protein
MVRSAPAAKIPRFPSMDRSELPGPNGLLEKSGAAAGDTFHAGNGPLGFIAFRFV